MVGGSTGHEGRWGCPLSPDIWIAGREFRGKDVAVAKAKRRQYAAEYKRDAARLVIDSGRSLRDVSMELGVNYETLRAWVLVSAYNLTCRTRYDLTCRSVSAS